MRSIGEVQGEVISRIGNWLNQSLGVDHVLAVVDSTGRVGFAVWGTQAIADFDLREAIAELDEGEREFVIPAITFVADKSHLEQEIFDDLYARATDELGSIKRLNTLSNHANWVSTPGSVIWNWRERCPVVAFTSYKGGVGRSTSLASFAIARARTGQRVVVVDGDFDAPGLDSIFQATIGPEATQEIGVVEYLSRFSNRLPVPELRDIYFGYRNSDVVGSGEILVFSAGRVGVNYVDSLGRIDLNDERGFPTAFRALLDQIATELEPNWILIDARSGLSEANALLLTGLAHFTVFVGTASRQTWSGLRLVLQRLGADRVDRNLRQAELAILQTMVPQEPIVAEAAISEFSDNLDRLFDEVYYVEDTGEYDTEYYTVRDKEAPDAPSIPIVIEYSPRVAYFRSLTDVTEILSDREDYAAMHDRISTKFSVPSEDET